MKYALSNNSKLFTFLFFASVIFMHFDPTGQKLTIAILHLILFIILYFKNSFSRHLPFIFLFVAISFPLFNLFLISNIRPSLFDFLKTYTLYLLSAVTHLVVIYSPLKSKYFKFEKVIKKALYLIFSITAIQFFSALIFKKPILFNLFGKYQYSNIVNLEELTYGILPRTQGFYLEPSYLAFVVITLIAISMNFNKNIIFMFVLGGITILMSGSRGGYLGFFLLFAYYQFNNFKLFSIKSIFLLLLIISFLIVFVLPVFSLLSVESLSTENSSQNVRFYQGFILCNYVLSNFFSGIPLGSLSQAYLLSDGEESSIFSFFIFNVIYHGWFSFLLIFFILYNIFLTNYHSQTRIFLLIYILLYFNMTGSILAPDTYFWFFCFYYTYRISKFKTRLIINEDIIV